MPLLAVNRQCLFAPLYFDHALGLDEQVDPQAVIEMHSVVVERYRVLSGGAPLKVPCEHGFVNRFKQPRSVIFVQSVVGCIHDLTGDLV